MAGSQEKTEKPSGKKLGEARSKGRVPKSVELNQLAVLGIGGVVLLFSAPAILDRFQQMVQGLWSVGFRPSWNDPLDAALFTQAATSFFVMIAPVVGTCFLVAVLINLLQLKGLILAFSAIKPNLSKLNPLAGFQRFVSLRSFLELAKSCIKLFIIGYLIYGALSSEYERLATVIYQEVGEILAVFGSLAWKIFVRVCGVMLVLSVLDFGYQRWQYMRDLRMTKQEVKEESKQSEGNPQIKGRIRSIQRNLARQRMMSAVPKASVVITNPTHYAVALLYESEMEAPRVVAKGLDHLARQIIKIARHHGVPVVQNPPLARALYQQVKLEATIPVNLYKAVARVLAYIYQRRKPRNG
ncbi:MAG: flagellar biosynthesis protein FlhB [Syntrophobacteraceae bacterium]|nr:flagellar biosynthesis protein FlhB [Syntrophobacteraceae bacterium]